MLFFPNAKINLGLHILNRRDDGYHDIETLMLPISLCDALEFIPSDKTNFTLSGIDLDIPPEKNLCIKAYQLLSSKFTLPPIAIHLHKVIAAGAGLGGGSSDAAFMLKKLNSYFNLTLSDKELIDLANQLGSDCPFFIYNSSCIATGKGEIIEPFSFSKNLFKVVVVHPGIHINTSWAYSMAKPYSNRPSLKSILSSKDPGIWKNELENDFEKIVFTKYPEIKELKDKLYDMGALYASMTGSGSAVFGLFNEDIPELANTFSCFSWQGNLL